jgi:hypothetical protein
MRFIPERFAMLVENEREWVELLLRITRQRAYYPEGAADETIGMMLRERARWLRK